MAEAHKDADDRALVDRVLGGDQEAYAMIMDRYEAIIYNMVLRVVGDLDDAADITQSAFVKAYRKLESYNPNFKFFSWIYRIALNEALNFKKRSQRSTSLQGDLESGAARPDQVYLQTEMTDHLSVALRALKFDHRIVIVLKHLMMLPYAEISTILDLPEKTVKSRLFTARQELRTQLVSQGYS